MKINAPNPLGPSVVSNVAPPQKMSLSLAKISLFFAVFPNLVPYS